MKKIILDTNFLLTSIKFKVPLFEEINRICNFKYQLYIIDKTLDELKNKKNEKLILKLIKNKKIKTIKTKKDKNVDSLILNTIKKDDIVATQDKKLKKKLKDKKIKLIIIKQKKYLSFV